jgi:hypothetical protein
MILHDEPNRQPIETMYAVLSIDGDGKEGVIVVPMGDFSGPLICSDKKLLPALEKMARAAIAALGSSKGYTVAEFQRVRVQQ